MTPKRIYLLENIDFEGFFNEAFEKGCHWIHPRAALEFLCGRALLDGLQSEVIKEYTGKLVSIGKECRNGSAFHVLNSTLLPTNGAAGRSLRAFRASNPFLLRAEEGEHLANKMKVSGP